MNNRGFAFLADIRASRNASDDIRFDMQRKLRSIIDVLNYVFRFEMLSTIEFSSGDSIQGLFNNESAPLRCSLLLNTLFYPYEVRVGIGIGEINSMIYEDGKQYKDDIDSNYLDGTVYHRARRALDTAKIYNTRVVVASDNLEWDSVINNMLIEATNYRERMSPSQKRLMVLCEFLNPILNHQESENYAKNFPDLVSFLTFDETIYNKYMYKEKLYQELFTIFELRKDMRFDGRSYNRYFHIFTADIMPRNSDIYLAKLYDVSPQNIWLLKKRGGMDNIRTLEMLAVNSLGRSGNND